MGKIIGSTHFKIHPESNYAESKFILIKLFDQKRILIQLSYYTN